jgi:hypothetical protein
LISFTSVCVTSCARGVCATLERCAYAFVSHTHTHTHIRAHSLSLKRTLSLTRSPHRSHSLTSSLAPPHSFPTPSPNYSLTTTSPSLTPHPPHSLTHLLTPIHSPPPPNPPTHLQPSPLSHTPGTKPSPTAALAPAVAWAQFSKVNSTVQLYSKFTRPLTFENLFQANDTNGAQLPAYATPAAAPAVATATIPAAVSAAPTPNQGIIPKKTTWVSGLVMLSKLVMLQARNPSRATPLSLSLSRARAFSLALSLSHTHTHTYRANSRISDA